MTNPTNIAQIAFEYYLTKGIGRNAAAGIVGVLEFESGLNPLAENNSGSETGGAINSKGSYGLAQWNGPRQQSLANFAAVKGYNVASLNTQLDFVLTECANSFSNVWTAIETNMDVIPFISLFVRTYENPAKPEPEIAGALATAQSLLALPVTTPALPATAPVQPISATADPELAALEALYAIMTPFPATARSRMVAYLNARLSNV